MFGLYLFTFSCNWNAVADVVFSQCCIVAPSKADVSLINKRLHSQLVSVQSDIEVLRKDPKSPLYHIKSFEALNLYVSHCRMLSVQFY